MAGIGFPLLRMYERTNLGSRVQAIGHAMFIAAGPSVLTILCFVLITVLTGGQATPAIVGFRVAVVYAFAIAFIIAAPVSLVAVRLVSDAFSQKDFSTLRGVYALALVLGGSVSLLAGGLVFGTLSGWDMGFVGPATALAGLVCCLFIAASFATAVREFRTVSLSFALGTGLSVVLVVMAIQTGAREGVILMTFHAGLVVALTGVTIPLLATFPDGSDGLKPLAQELALAFRQHWMLAVGGFLGGLGIWIDKFVLWTAGTSTLNGLLHRPSYDSSIFVAFVLILPSISIFLVLSETELFRGFRRYQGTIESRGTLRQIEAALFDARDRVTRLIFRLSLVQIFVAIIAAIAAPVAVSLFGLAHTQASALRFLMLASAFQFAFLASSSVILFVGDVRRYAALQALFFALNLILTLAVKLIAPDRMGLGYLLACAICAVLAFGVQIRSIENLNADILARA